MTLLIVDDDTNALEDMVQSLKPSGYQVTSTNDPLEALEFYNKKRFDAVISDIRMPGMNGIELLREIRKVDPKAKVILLTAFGDLATAIAAVNNHAYSFFGKPLEFKDLMDCLHSIEKELHGEVSIDHPSDLKAEYEKLKQAYDSLSKLTQAEQ